MLIGAQQVATRNGWILANLCGDQKVIVAAETLEEAERAALYREIDLKLFYVQHLPPCRRVLTVDPLGTVTGANTEYSVGISLPSPDASTDHRNWS